jgi:hypothetical protein
LPQVPISKSGVTSHAAASPRPLGAGADRVRFVEHQRGSCRCFGVGEIELAVRDPKAVRSGST